MRLLNQVDRITNRVIMKHILTKKGVEICM